MTIKNDLLLQYKSGGIVQKLIFWNIGIFVFFSLIEVILTLSKVSFSVNDYLALASNPMELLQKPWVLVSYFFMHATVLHLIFNMITLHFSGQLFRTFFTEKQLFGVYILGGLFAGCIYLISYFVFHNNGLLVGASGAIMAVLIAATTYSPFYLLRLPLIGIVKLWHIAFFILFLDFIQLPLQNTGGHIAHLGGALFGFIFVKTLKNGNDLSLIVTNFLNFISNLGTKKTKTPFQKIHRNKNPKPFSEKNVTQKQIDEILDKISKSGYESLTKQEKEFLFKAGK